MMVGSTSHHEREADDALTFMTFGDGDFSFSLDLAKYLLSTSCASDNGRRQRRRCRLVATSIDSRDEVHAKYRDAPYLLKQLERIDKKEDSLSVALAHGVNALVPPQPGCEHDCKADHVIFNHPHIGREDAALHSRFLSHFLHSASCHWMKENGGVLHLTLVKGQYERWKCKLAAQRHSLVLLERNSFVSPPGGEHYQHRRHQTGKSFASRATGGSETFTFGRMMDEGKYVASCPPWQQHACSKTSVDVFPCPHCDKSFRQERSLKNHVKAVHFDEPNKKRKRGVISFFPCVHCQDVNLTRVFAHQKALDDHVRAKHNGLHSNIQPDWLSKDTTGSSTETSAVKTNVSVDDGDASRRLPADSPHGSCSICGIVYRSEEEKVGHSKEFIPLPVSDLTTVDLVSYACSFCNRNFCDLRAQRQHENVCADRSRAPATVHPTL